MDTLRLFEEEGREKLTGWPWIREKVATIKKEGSDSDFYLAFSMIHRKVAEYWPEWDNSFLHNANRMYPGFRADNWSARDLARSIFVLSLPADKRIRILENLFTTADIGEQVTLYRLLYFLPDAEKYVGRASEGIRTNMTSVFDAIALDNPFPARYFNKEAWNQMVLKAVFMERPLYRISGLDARSNADLSHIALDFAHERWAAGREVTPELWRLTQKFISQDSISDLEKVLGSANPLEKEAGLLALQTSNSSVAHGLMEKFALAISNMTWEEIGKSIQSK